MKRARHWRSSHDAKYRTVQRNNEERAGGFSCSHCKQWVVINPFIGTANRNHCNWCFWSKHVDIKKGDRRATCQAGMRPIALTLKHEGFGRVGEVMIVHYCAGCTKLSINRIARDDPEDSLLVLFQESLALPDVMQQALTAESIDLLDADDEALLRQQLFGTAI